MVDYQGYFLLFLAWLVSTIVVRAILTKKQDKPNRRAPGPPALPIIGHLHLLFSLPPQQSLHKLSTRYGPIMQIFLGFVPCVVVSTPEIAKEFLKTHETNFSDRPERSVIDYLTYGYQDFAFAPYGPYWKFMKKLCISELLGGQTLTQLLPLRRQETLRFLRLLFKKGKASETIDVGGELWRTSNNIVSRMMIGQTYCQNDSEAKEMRKLVEDTLHLMGQFNLSDCIWLFRNWDLQGFGKKVREIRGRFDSMIDRAIKEYQEERRKRKERGGDGQIKDLLEILLDIHEDENSDIKLTKDKIKAFIWDILMGGTDTSTLTTEWALAELINNPHVMEKARQEIDTVIGKSRIVEESDIDNLPYLQAIVKETLRIHPPTPILIRQSSKSCTVLGYEIPAKTQLFINVWAIGKDPNHWENPLEFKPERFISKEGGGKGQLDVRGQHFHFIPFGTGRRGCPGISLGLQMVQANLAAMIQCFEWKVNGGNQTVDMEEKPAFTLLRAHPLICVPMPRFDSFPTM